MTDDAPQKVHAVIANEDDEAEFTIDYPAEEGTVWMTVGDGGGLFRIRLGVKDAVAEKLTLWLASVDQDENGR